VTRDDARNIGDIEKLIKTKIELEPFELEDDRPRRRRAPDDDGGRPAEARPRERAPERAERVERAPRQAPRDPFFDQPYEPQASAKDVVEPVATATPAPARSPNIRPARKVGALLGGGKG
jgi:ATP-dependent RNA helicase RhlE